MRWSVDVVCGYSKRKSFMAYISDLACSGILMSSRGCGLGGVCGYHFLDSILFFSPYCKMYLYDKHPFSFYFLYGVLGRGGIGWDGGDIVFCSFFGVFGREGV